MVGERFSKERRRKTIPKEIPDREREKRIFGIFVHEIAKMRWVYLLEYEGTSESVAGTPSHSCLALGNYVMVFWQLKF